MQQIYTQEFASAADVLTVLKQFAQKLVWHQRETVNVQQKRHDEKPGKPK